MVEVRHGGPVEEPPQDVFLSDDPEAEGIPWLKCLEDEGDCDDEC